MDNAASQILNEPLESSILKGIDFLQQHQYANGEFCIYMSGDDAMQSWNQPDSSVFASALIGNALVHLKERPRVEDILNKTAAFLRYQMGRGGTWNHYTNHHHLRKLCPQDVDDTACVSVFLRDRGVDFPIQHNRSLILSNRNHAGLFYTWFALRPGFNSNADYWRLALAQFRHPLKAWMFWRKMECRPNDIDAVVNANVLYYFGESEETRPVVDLLKNVILNHQETDCDKWYRNPYSVYYFFSRNYQLEIGGLEEIRQPVIDRILKSASKDGMLGSNIIDTALNMCTLMNFNFTGNLLTEAASFLMGEQESSGSWPRWRLYYGGPKKITGFGSEELTTAFCLEALERFRLNGLKAVQQSKTA